MVFQQGGNPLGLFPGQIRSQFNIPISNPPIPITEMVYIPNVSNEDHPMDTLFKKDPHELQCSGGIRHELDKPLPGMTTRALKQTVLLRTGSQRDGGETMQVTTVHLEYPRDLSPQGSSFSPSLFLWCLHCTSFVVFLTVWTSLGSYLILAGDKDLFCTLSINGYPKLCLYVKNLTELGVSDPLGMCLELFKEGMVHGDMADFFYKDTDLCAYRQFGFVR